MGSQTGAWCHWNRPCDDDISVQLHEPVVGRAGMTAASEAPELLLQHHLEKLRLPTVLKEYEKLARQAVSRKWWKFEDGVISG